MNTAQNSFCAPLLTSVNNSDCFPLKNVFLRHCHGLKGKKKNIKGGNGEEELLQHEDVRRSDVQRWLSVRITLVFVLPV